MRNIAKLLFGEGADELLGRIGVGDGDGFGMADRARRSGEWCGSTPGHDSAGDAVHGARGPIRHQVIIREWQSH